MVYGVFQVQIRLLGTFSLKDKRSIVRKIVERVRNRHFVSIHEVADHDLIGNATFGIALTGTDAIVVENVIQAILKSFDENPEIEVYDTVIHVDHLK